MAHGVVVIIKYRRSPQCHVIGPTKTTDITIAVMGQIKVDAPNHDQSTGSWAHRRFFEKFRLQGRSA